MNKFIYLILGIFLGAVPMALASNSFFFDVSDEDWYANAVFGLQDKGILEGYPDGTYKPSSCVNRAEMAVTFDRVLDYLTE